MHRTEKYIRRALYFIIGIIAIIVVISVGSKGFSAVFVGEEVESNLPIFVIRMDSPNPVDFETLDEYDFGVMDIIENIDGKYKFAHPYSETKVSARHHVALHIRGESSRHYAKKQLSLKILEDDLQHNKDVGLLGFPKQHKYVLFASSSDGTIIRNRLSFEMSANTGRYAPRMKYIELFIVPNNSSDVLFPLHYAGVYALEESIKRGEDLVDIKKMKANNNTKQDDKDITGGYIFKLDKDNTGDIRFDAIVDHYTMVYPDGDDVSDNMLEYLSNYMSNFEAATMEPSFTYLGQRYSDMIDLDSVVDAVIIQEVGKNQDAYHFSTYFHKDRKGPVVYGPIWDMDRTFGHQFALYDLNQPTGFLLSVAPGNPYHDHLNIQPWLQAIARDPLFRNKAVARYTEFRKGFMSNKNLQKTINQYKKELTAAGAIEREYDRWGPWYYPLKFWTTKSYFESELDILLDFMYARLEWMDDNIHLLGEI